MTSPALGDERNQIIAASDHTVTPHSHRSWAREGFNSAVAFLVTVRRTRRSTRQCPLKGNMSQIRAELSGWIDSLISVFSYFSSHEVVDLKLTSFDSFLHGRPWELGALQWIILSPAEHSNTAHCKVILLLFWQSVCRVSVGLVTDRQRSDSC